MLVYQASESQHTSVTHWNNNNGKKNSTNCSFSIHLFPSSSSSFASLAVVLVKNFLQAKEVPKKKPFWGRNEDKQEWNRKNRKKKYIIRKNWPHTKLYVRDYIYIYNLLETDAVCLTPIRVCVLLFFFFFLFILLVQCESRKSCMG